MADDSDDRQPTDLAAMGIDPRLTRAARDVDTVLQNWRRRVNRRELGHHALRDLGLPLELAQLDAMAVICPPGGAAGQDDAGEIMVATVAQRLGIDPSRASRIAGELIRLGLAERAVSQEDARRTVLRATLDGSRVVEAVHAYKLLVLGDFLKSWTADEIATFLPLLDRFSTWADNSGKMAAERDTEVAGLRASLPRIGDAEG
ncbi:MarR family winged helix-turn-helix transcriptional regulator [Tropicimonas sp. IMCC34011]|uniref:MarR family winged helix-turn-helix transcriptional regulator n=1 Tax=Tropicimonas sp. IMCC34011 TaxID=2248759 RepID=UPI001E491A3D|nr:MarR family transcriptional regulator [Tropicimonas sp. IMCC34011]